MTSETRSEEERFVETLNARFREAREQSEDKDGFDRGGRAILRRHAGKTLDESPRAFQVFYKLNPPRGEAEQRAFLLASLFCLGRGRAGPTLARALRSLEQEGYSLKGLERRLIQILDSTDVGELAFRLSQIVKLLSARKQGVDWTQLLRDLNRWHLENRSAQKRWASDFYLTDESSPSAKEDQHAL